MTDPISLLDRDGQTKSSPLLPTNVSRTLDAYFNFIQQLYITENKTLDDVMILMKSQHGLEASKFMYKKKIRQWGLYKHHNDKVYLEVATQEKSSSSLPTSTQNVQPKRGRGRPPKPHSPKPNVLYGVTVMQVKPKTTAPKSSSKRRMTRMTNQFPQVPAALHRVLPSPSAIKMSEEMVYAIRAFVSARLDVRLEGETYTKTDFGVLIKRKRVQTPSCIMEMDIATNSGFQAMHSKASPLVYGAFFEKTFRLVHNVMTCNHFMITLGILMFLLETNRHKADDLGRMMLQYVCRLTDNVFGPSHPHSIWTRNLLGLLKTPNIILIGIETMAKAIQEKLGPLDDYNLIMRVNMLDASIYYNSFPPSQTVIMEKFETLMQDCLNTPYINDYPVKAVQYSFAQYLKSQGLFIKAEEILAIIPTHVEQEDKAQNSRLLHSRCALAEVQAAMGKDEMAEETFTTAINMAKSAFGLEDGDTILAAQRYALFLRSRGRIKEADKIFASVQQNIEPFMLQEAMPVAGSVLESSA